MTSYLDAVADRIGAVLRDRGALTADELDVIARVLDVSAADLLPPHLTSGATTATEQGRPWCRDGAVEPHLTAHLAAIGTNQSPQSVSARKRTILRVAKKLGHPVAETTYPALLAWQISQAHLQRSSMAAALTHLNCYLAWVVRQGHRPDNPAEALARPRHAYAKDPKPLSDIAIGQALACAEPLMHAWISLGAFCGLRCMEIASVTRADILDGEPLRLVIHGKGGKDRTVRLPEGLARELASDEFFARGHLWRDEEGPYRATKVSRLINNHFRNHDIPGTAHMLRHRFGTELYRATRDVVAVKDALGHANIDTTMCYVRAVGDSRTDDAIEAISHLAAATGVPSQQPLP